MQASVPESNPPKDPQGSSLHAALTRTLTRSAALYFSRPVRLFRPAKVSGWISLRGLALRDGRQADPRYLKELLNTKGFMVIPKHFVPPLLVNALLGTVLWATYAEASSALDGHTHPIAAAFLSGGLAGGMQALVAAPADNIRHAIEGGSGGWSHAWKEVFRGTEPITTPHSKAESFEQARRVREWMREVGEMAGRGWNGWGWTMAKDVCGFSVFFAIFEGTRRVAATTTSISQDILSSRTLSHHEAYGDSTHRHASRAVHAMTLVIGGVCAGLVYEIVCRPWDAARKLLNANPESSIRTQASHRHQLIVLSQKIQEEGFAFLFKAPHPIGHERTSMPSSRRKFYAVLRTLGRVGPWGVGFLMWEAYGPGLGFE